MGQIPGRPDLGRDSVADNEPNGGNEEVYGDATSMFNGKQPNAEICHGDERVATARVCYGCGVGDHLWRACPLRDADVTLEVPQMGQGGLQDALGDFGAA
ncbi:hypothetical protein CK203_058950 [Vitis vinifera]|uniref:CCHC-type domain-containing protein n=1 Tax=Vitis vinifera TaxID=29760 RepID=A0A438FTE7_VITVI|nr:hypothetical protein CK203_058950 [Vitis vinifera]